MMAHSPPNHGRARRRVLIIVQNLPVPLDRRVWLEATALREAGHDVSVICPKSRQYKRSFERLDGIDIYRYPIPIDAQSPFGFVFEFAWCFLLSALISVRVAWFGRGFDVIHACNPPETYWLLGLMWRSFGKRFLFDHHDLSPEMYGAKFGKTDGLAYRGLRFLERMTFRTADVVITTNRSHREVALSRGGVSPHKIHIVRSGPDLVSLKRHDAERSWRRGKRHHLVYLGEICKQDGVDYLIRALKILRDERSRRDFHCTLVGGGPHQPVIKAYASEIGVEDVCTFTGRVSDDVLSRILSSADVGIDPDPKNEWSDKSTMNKVMEYMHFGLPVVAFDLAETRFSAQSAGSFAIPNEEADLARCIDALLDDPERRRAMGEAGMRRVRRELAWEYSVPNLLNAYDDVFGDLSLQDV
jgi:glycosyltransferase involved in cell wall biosynthesis